VRALTRLRSRLGDGKGGAAAAFALRWSASSRREITLNLTISLASRAINVLALYDIHGNIDALDAVLADPRASDPDVVVVGGDAVPGAFARATLDCLEALSAPVRWVRGNGEREVAESVGGPARPDEDVPGRTAVITAAEIGDERALALGELPLTLELDGVLFCHASPRCDEEMLTRLSSPARWADALEGVDAALVVAGHTHQQDDRVVVGGVRFVNAGSVGQPYEGDGAAFWLWVADGVPQLRRTAYDAAGAGTRILAAGWPDEESVEAALIEPVDPIVVTQAFEEIARS
jgi:predicted phosphodiesterase